MPTVPMKGFERGYLLLGIKIVSEFSAAIAIPVVAAAMLGKRLDEAYGTKPVFLIAGFAIAAALSTVYVVSRTRAFAKEYEALDAITKARVGNKNAKPPSPHTL